MLRGKQTHAPMNIQPYRKKEKPHAHTHTHAEISNTVGPEEEESGSTRVEDHMRPSGHYSYTDSNECVCVCVQRECRAVKKGRCILYTTTPCLLHTLEWKVTDTSKAAVEML